MRHVVSAMRRDTLQGWRACDGSCTPTVKMVCAEMRGANLDGCHGGLQQARIKCELQNGKRMKNTKLAIKQRHTLLRVAECRTRTFFPYPLITQSIMHCAKWWSASRCTGGESWAMKQTAMWVTSLQRARPTTASVTATHVWAERGAGGAYSGRIAGRGERG